MILPTLVLASLLGAQSLDDAGAPAADDGGRRAPSVAPAAVHDGSARQLDVPVVQRTSVRVRVDGRLDDAAWSEASVLSGFTQFDPIEGVPASQATRVRVFVDEDAVYFGIEADDDDGGGIRATLARRDDYGRTDDWVRIALDTFDDRRRAFVFQVNPLGIQGDGLWVEGRGGRGGPVDWSPDFLWESAGELRPGGWTAEIRVPLKSLRFPGEAVQDWGLQVTRRIQRTGYESSWAPFTSDQADRMAQFGALRGLRDLDPGVFLEVNPVLTGSRIGGLDEAGRFRREDPSGSFGLNVTYGLTSNLTLDGTVNPDFSQVEADAGQITVNERFAIRLPEKRPFFLEGTDVFSMSEQLVYTRSIGNPVGAAKISGKVGGLTVAYLGAVDDTPEADNPIVNLVRVKGDLGASSSLGAVYTDRTTPGAAFNRVAGVDGRFVLGQRWTVEAVVAGSADGTSGSDAAWGSLVKTRVERSGRTFSGSGSFRDVTRDFRAGSGFLRRRGVTEADVRGDYTFRGGSGAFVERWGPSLEVEGTWDRDGFWSGRGPEEMEVQLGLSASFRGNVGGYLSLSRSAYTFDAAGYDGLFVAAADGSAGPAFAPSSARFQGLDAVRLRTWISRWDKVRLSLGGSFGETPIFERTFGLPAEVANEVGADVSVDLQPTGSLAAGLGLRHATLRRKADGSTYSSATIPRIQARYQFSRSLFVRGLAEYASQERADVLDPATGRPVLSCGDAGCVAQEGSDRHDVSLEALVGFEPSPGTVVYVGYSRQMRDPVGFRFQDVETRSDGLFVKLSWRFRM